VGFLNFASSFLRIPILCVLLFATAPSQSNAVICNPIEQLRSLFRKDKPFDRDAYQLRVEEFKKTIINNKWEKVEKLSSIDQVALMEALTKSKGRNPLDLADLLQKDPKIRNQEKDHGCTQTGTQHPQRCPFCAQHQKTCQYNQTKGPIGPKGSKPGEIRVILRIQNIVQYQIGQKQRRQRHKKGHPATTKIGRTKQANGTDGRKIVGWGWQKM
jgi:hypothetical protein